MTKLSKNERAHQEWPRIITEIYFGLVLLTALTVIIKLILIPADSRNALFLGLSLSRMILIAIPLAMAIAAGWLEIKCATREGFSQRILSTILHPKWSSKILIFSNLFVLGGVASIFFYQFFSKGDYKDYVFRIYPLLLMVFAVGVITLGLFLALNISSIHGIFKNDSLMIKAAAWFLLIMACVVLFVMISGIGIIPDSVDWGEPGVPLLEIQILGVWAGCIAAVGINLIIKKIWKTRKVSEPSPVRILNDIVICLLIWGAAVILWTSLPIPTSTYFTPRIKPPTYQIYPYSDSSIYDSQAQAILNGESFASHKQLYRPIYAFILAGIHALVGQDYQSVVNIQTLLFGLIPVLIYLLGKQLHSRLAGLAAAAFMILREANAIQVTGLTTISSSKLLMTELPTTIGVCLIGLVSIIWLKSPGRRKIFSLILGGIFGIWCLVRFGTLLILLAVFFSALVIYWKQRKNWLLTMGLLLLGLGVAVIPMMTRDYLSSGIFGFSEPLFSGSGALAKRFDPQNGSAYTKENTENNIEYNNRMTKDTLAYSFTHVGEVAWFVSDHYLNNVIHTFQILPLRSTFYKDITEINNIKDLFWLQTNGRTSNGQYVLGLFYLIVLAIGLGAAWKKNKVVGIVPVLIAGSYILFNAAFRISGPRYILPVDWVGYFYFAIGLAQITFWGYQAYGCARQTLNSSLLCSYEVPTMDREEPLHRDQILMLASVIFIIGLASPLIERMVPSKYSNQNRDQLIQTIETSEDFVNSGISNQELENFIQQDGVLIERGVALYPRFYTPGTGLPGHAGPANEPKPYARLSFIFQDMNQYWSMERLGNPLMILPGNSDVIMVGCQMDSYVDVSMLMIDDGSGRIYFREEPVPMSCPSEPQ